MPITTAWNPGRRSPGERKVRRHHQHASPQRNRPLPTRLGGCGGGPQTECDRRILSKGPGGAHELLEGRASPAGREASSLSMTRFPGKTGKQPRQENQGKPETSPSLQGAGTSRARGREASRDSSARANAAVTLSRAKAGERITGSNPPGKAIWQGRVRSGSGW